MSESWQANGAGGGLSGADAAELSRQIAGLASASLPLAKGLVALGDELPRGRLRRSMNELATALESGVTLDRAVVDHGPRIPGHLRGLVIAGMRSGRLGDVLSRFSEYAGVGTELKRRLWLNLAYPILTVCVAMLLFFFVCVVLVGQFEAIYLDFNIPLPGITRLLIAVGRVVRSIWAPVAILGGSLVVGWLLAHVSLPQATRRAIAARLPLVGAVWRSTSVAEFCHLLALLLESHLPLPEALRLTGEGVQDADIDASCRSMAGKVESGRSLAESMEERRLFPAGLPRLLQWAEREKSLPEVLHMAGAMFESRARAQTTFVGTVFNVFCVMLVLAMVMVIPALFIPLITLISKLSG
jgi:general secretion pathway protein F